MRRGPWHHKLRCKERPRNCSDFVDDICRECDNGFALKALNFPRCKKTVCVPCGWRLKRKDPALFLKQCVEECPRNCSLCEEGSCKECEPGFFGVESRRFQRRVCVPCGLKMKMYWPDVYLKECTEDGCGRGCANCSAPGLCTECNEGLKLLTPPNSNITKCVRSCPPFYKLDKDSSLPRCELRAKPNNNCGKLCMNCSDDGVCLKCIEPLRLVKFGSYTTCKRQCPFPFRRRLDPDSQLTICERPAKNTRKGGRNPTLSDVP